MDYKEDIEDIGAMGKGVEAMLEGHRTRFADGKYSDLTITAQGRGWKVHRFVVCTACDFFAKACDGQFMEAVNGVINLPDDNADAVQVMLEFMYDGEFPSFEDQMPTRVCDDVYHLADKYMLPLLKAKAMERFQRRLACGGSRGEDFISCMPDPPAQGGDELQLACIDHVAENFPAIFGASEVEFEGMDFEPSLREFLTQRPVLVHRAATIWATKRFSDPHYKCYGDKCRSRGVTFQIPRGAGPKDFVTCPSGCVKTDYSRWRLFIDRT